MYRHRYNIARILDTIESRVSRPSFKGLADLALKKSYPFQGYSRPVPAKIVSPSKILSIYPRRNRIPFKDTADLSLQKLYSVPQKALFPALTVSLKYWYSESQSRAFSALAKIVSGLEKGIFNNKPLSLPITRREHQWSLQTSVSLKQSYVPIASQMLVPAKIVCHWSKDDAHSTASILEAIVSRFQTHFFNELAGLK